jgi:VIT1/CCC1 family predicted Fe2+/Mn2+ transporter
VSESVKEQNECRRQTTSNAGEQNRTDRIGWLRAAVLGANDGILSTASLVLGVAAAHGTHSNVLVAGVTGLVAGAMSMAADEYASVHSQADAEHAEIELERNELKADDKGEQRSSQRFTSLAGWILRSRNRSPNS